MNKKTRTADTMMKRMMYVSYSREDVKKVRLVCKHLELKGFDVYMGEESLDSGGYEQDVVVKIKQSDLVLFFYSENTEKSIGSKQEVEFALSLGKSVIPVLLNEVGANKWYDLFLGKFQCVQFADGSEEGCADSIILIVGQYRKSDDEKQHGPSVAPNTHSTTGYSSDRTSAKTFKRMLYVIVGVFVVLVLAGILLLPFTYHHFALGNIGKVDSLESFEMGHYTGADDTIWDYIMTNDDSVVIGRIHHAPDSLDILFPGKDSFEYEDESIWSDFLPVIILLVFGGGFVVLLLGVGFVVGYLYKEGNKDGMLKLSSDVAANVSIDGQLECTLASREVYKKSLAEGVYLIDFEDIRMPGYFLRYKQGVCSGESRVLYAEFCRNMVQPVMQNSRDLKTIKCFIAGSKLLQQERDALRASTCVMYNKLEGKDFRILSYTFEDFERSAVIGGHQKQYNDFISNEADWALFVIDGQIGGITVEEYRKAMDSYKKNGRPRILVLAKAGTEDVGEIKAIKDEINKESQYWTDYTDLDNMKLIFENTLFWNIMKMYN